MKAASKPAMKDAPGEDHEAIFEITDFPQNYVKFHIHKHTAGKHPARAHNVVHISDLDPAREWCPREPAILSYTKTNRPDGFTSTAQAMTWGMGEAGADLLISMIPPEQVWGHWKCRACDHKVRFAYTPKLCEKCGAKRAAFKYQEVLVRDPDTGIVGSVDCFVDILSNGLRTGIEIKTEGNDSFKKRTKPTFDHEWRCKGYMWLMSRDPLMKGKHLNLKEMRVLYFTKEGWDTDLKIKEWPVSDSAKSSVKEYWSRRDDTVIENQLERARAYREWRNAHDKDGGIHLSLFPDRIPKCKSIGCARAKQCSVKVKCWGPDTLGPTALGAIE